MAEGHTVQERAMVAAAMLAARYLDAALRSGMGKEEIDGALAQVACASGVSEIWITDEHGRIVFGSGDLEFTFPVDPAAASQAAPFAALLLGTESVVVQEPRPVTWMRRSSSMSGSRGWIGPGSFRWGWPGKGEVAERTGGGQPVRAFQITCSLIATAPGGVSACTMPIQVTRARIATVPDGASASTMRSRGGSDPSVGAGAAWPTSVIG